MLLDIENLSKSYGKNQVLEDVSLTLRESEINCIVGPSGEGKTTLLRCICQLETIDSGRITIEGKDLCYMDGDELKYCDKNKAHSLMQEIGLVFQEYNLFPHMTVMENLLLSPSYHDMDKDAMEERAKNLLEELGLIDKKDHYPFELSGGQKQRTAVARACMLQPKILCFDEPTSALDFKSRGQIMTIVKRLAKNENMAILIVSHDEDFVDSVADRIFRVENKKVKEVKKAA